ncbi:MAG: ABC transporter ATP-binding protein [Chthoniobacterales bacterium]
MAKITLLNILADTGGDQRLEIDDRKFTVLAGPAGSGKTGVLRAIAGLEQRTRGEILIGEKKVDDLTPSERKVAMVFSEDALYPGMSVRENIAFGLKRRSFSESEMSRRVQDAAAALSITELLDRKPSELSVVDRQRTSIARAIARQPEVILFDEPLARFDAATRARLRADLRQLHQRLETTFVYATRDPAEAMALGEQVIILHDGRVEQHDATAVVYRAPANLFVAGFFGAPPMNFISGRLKLERETVLFRESGEGTIEARLPIADFPALAERNGQEIALGVRPEDIGIIQAAKGAEPENSFPVLVDFIETAGAETTFHLQTGAHSIVARRLASAESEPAGRRVRCQFDLNRIQFFDSGTGQRVVER